jgi:hypothetical protein
MDGEEGAVISLYKSWICFADYFTFYNCIGIVE